MKSINQKIKMVILASCVFFAAGNLMAQALSSEDIKAQYVKEWTRAKKYTDAYLKTMPAGKYDLRPTDSIRTFAQQMLHLAEANTFFMASATGAKPPAMPQDAEHSASAQTPDSVKFYVDASYDFCIKAASEMDVNKWGEKVKFFGMDMTRFAILIKGFEHQTHHRGQTTIYIRLAGVKPPNEMLF
jgi:uncharacterized damage-inducible protein DinB